MSSQDHINIVIQGDSRVGKTSLLFREFHDTFRNVWIRTTVFDAFDAKVDAKKVIVNGSPLKIYPFECTRTGENHEFFWHGLPWEMADVCLFCFSLTDQLSYENILNDYFVGYRKYCPGKPIVLVGNKHDLVNDPETIEYLKERKRLSPITTVDGMKLAREINAVSYFECSALTGEGVNDVFLACAVVGRNYKYGMITKRGCTVL